MRRVRHYSLYGSTIRSRLSLPFLPRIEPITDGAEVTLRLAEEIPGTDRDFECLLETARASTEERSVFRLGRTSVAPEGGEVDQLSWDRLMDVRLHDRYVDIRVRPGSPRREVEARLLGPVAAYWLERSGRLALHASALAFDESTFLVAGPTGTGKSTFVAAGLAAGARFLADDLTAVIPSDGPLQVPAGPPLLRLVPETARRIGLSAVPAASRAPIRRGKVQVRLHRRDARARRLAAVLLLDPSRRDPSRRDPSCHGPERLVQMQPAEAFPHLQGHCYVGPEVADRAGFEESRFLALTRLLAEVPVYRLTLPRDLDGLVSRVVRIVESLAKD